MADQYTTTGTVDYAQAAYDRLAYFALRPELYFDAVASVKPEEQAMPGTSVIFTIQNDMAVATTPLSEVLDVSAVAISDSQVTVTLQEYGNATISSAKLRGTAFVDIPDIMQNVVGFNSGVSLDTIARDVIKAGTNVAYSLGTTTQPTSRATVTYTDATHANTFGAHDVRASVAFLRRKNVRPFSSGYYAAYIDPDVSVDLREETGNAGWTVPHDYSAPDNIWMGEIGAFGGARFIETPRAPVFPNAGASSTNVYRTLFCGNQALAKAWSKQDGNGPYPVVVEGPIVDKLRRFLPMGWYWLGGYSIFRQDAIYAIESAALLGGTTSGGDHVAIDA